jgi:hypothetical protein
MRDETGKAKTVNIPEGDVRLPAAENWFEKLREQVIELLHRWFVHGRPQ